MTCQAKRDRPLVVLGPGGKYRRIIRIRPHLTGPSRRRQTYIAVLLAGFVWGVIAGYLIARHTLQ